jgi:putative ABC transport system permease protein
VQGVRDAGPIAFSDVSVTRDSSDGPLDVSLIGVEPGKPGEPPVTEGRGLLRKTANEAIIDYNLALAIALEPGDILEVRSVQGNREEYYALTIVGVCDSRKYSLQPSVFVPLVVWDEIRPSGIQSSTQDEQAYNVVAVQLEDPTQIEQIRRVLQIQVSGIEVVDRTTAYESAPGYQSIQSSLATQSAFALLIGMLVIGGFFQIQTLQKVPQIGMLKAIGTPNRTIAIAAIIQILAVTLMGVIIGCLPAIGLSGLFPPDVPIVFEIRSVATAAFSILAMGLLGGLVSIRFALRVEPLIALGLSS